MSIHNIQTINRFFKINVCIWGMITLFIITGCQSDECLDQATPTQSRDSASQVINKIPKVAVQEKDTDSLKKDSELVQPTLPYNTRIDVDAVHYNITHGNLVGAENFLCGEKFLRFLPLPAHPTIKVILVPQDCGDFPYRLYLLTIQNNTVVDSLYVEGEWFEPENVTEKELTTFSINEDYIISVQTYSNGKTSTERYAINRAGKIITVLAP